MNAQLRQRLYLILSAVVPLLVGYGVISQDQVGLWVALGAAVLGAGGTALAASNTKAVESDAGPSSSSTWATGRHAKPE